MKRKLFLVSIFALGFGLFGGAPMGFSYHENDPKPSSQDEVPSEISDFRSLDNIDPAGQAEAVTGALDSASPAPNVFRNFDQFQDPIRSLRRGDFARMPRKLRRAPPVDVNRDLPTTQRQRRKNRYQGLRKDEKRFKKKIFDNEYDLQRKKQFFTPERIQEKYEVLENDKTNLEKIQRDIQLITRQGNNLPRRRMNPLPSRSNFPTLERPGPTQKLTLTPRPSAHHKQILQGAGGDPMTIERVSGMDGKPFFQRMGSIYVPESRFRPMGINRSSPRSQGEGGRDGNSAPLLRNAAAAGGNTQSQQEEAAQDDHKKRQEAKKQAQKKQEIKRTTKF